MEHYEHNPAGPDSFETGSTNPPKTRGGIIAVLLVTVIFLAGFLRVLSLLNIGLFPPKPGGGTGILSSAAETCATGSDPGFSGNTVTALSQRFYSCPKGVLIRQVTSGSAAALAGVAVGDVLVQLGGEAITDEASLQTVLQQHQPGDKLSAVFFRGGISYTCTLTLGANN